MKNVYPIVLKKGSKDNYIVFIPDFNINTEERMIWEQLGKTVRFLHG